jgi:flagellin FlaB
MLAIFRDERMKPWNSSGHHDNGFTGLEAAIVLIAFVVVAAVFSYVVLGAGFFTSQTAQATVHTGVSQASSSILIGDIYGIAATSGAAHLDYINITVSLTAGGTPLDLDQMVVSYSDSSGFRNASVQQDTSITCPNTITGNHAEWCVADRLNNAGTPNDVLDPGEQIVIAVGMPNSAAPNAKFTVNFQPSSGAVTSVVRTIPGAIGIVNPLY